MAIVTPADRPKSVRNRCVIEVFGGVLCVVTLLFGFFCRCKGFCHRAESDLFLFSSNNCIHRFVACISTADVILYVYEINGGECHIETFCGPQYC